MMIKPRLKRFSLHFGIKLTHKRFRSRFLKLSKMSIYFLQTLTKFLLLCALITEIFSAGLIRHPEEISDISSLTTDIILESPIITQWGEWGPFDYCPPGTYAAGMSLKVEPYQGDDDDTALNGIKLLCIPPGSNNFSDSVEISSSVNQWGFWGKTQYCDAGVVTGFQLKSEVYQGGSKRRIKDDDTGANGLRIFCSNLPNGGYLEDVGGEWGDWTAPQKCLSQQAVCGIQTQDQEYVGSGDDTALNNVRMKCCTLTNIGSTCDPTDHWETILECDNTLSESPLTCTYQKNRGISRSSMASESVLNEHSVMTDIGFTSSLLYNGLSLNFAANLSASSATGYSWRSETSETFHESVTTTAEFVVPGCTKARLSQAVGNCGAFSVYTNYFRKEDLLPGTNIVVEATLFSD
ncbi:uncharacterized protein LOC110859120 [Folsomia candida]|uniref:uncharacterized protein LOC110859120 n=1 Tax=Folsomia candida TaxID=158441 RepID=UPI001604B71A|nr:uncharacterized protein LOC110859120 [Folsomia candida]